MTWPRQKVNEVIALSRLGLDYCELTRMTGVPRSTVRNWLSGQIPTPEAGQSGCFKCHPAGRGSLQLLSAAYAYLFGMYLGDGCISGHPRGVRRLRISLDRSYPVIVQECEAAMSIVVPRNKVLVTTHPTSHMDEVSAYSKHWPCLLPQHGAGRKHERRIQLEAWQLQILDRWPWRFLRGLIHSDGCRIQNPAIHPRKTYWYPRYSFSNRSDDIRGLFAEYCEKVGVECRQSNRWNVSVAKRDTVALMDLHIGAKR